MNIKLVIVRIVILGLLSLNVEACEKEERIYLLQILNQLNAMKPLVIAASKEQPRTNRIQFHYLAYTDKNKKQHNGLLEDLNQIEIGIQHKLNQVPNEPSIVSPIQGDYITQARS